MMGVRIVRWGKPYDNPLFLFGGMMSFFDSFIAHIYPLLGVLYNYLSFSKIPPPIFSAKNLSFYRLI